MPPTDSATLDTVAGDDSDDDLLAPGVSQAFGAGITGNKAALSGGTLKGSGSGWRSSPYGKGGGCKASTGGPAAVARAAGLWAQPTAAASARRAARSAEHLEETEASEAPPLAEDAGSVVAWAPAQTSGDGDGARAEWDATDWGSNGNKSVGAAEHHAFGGRAEWDATDWGSNGKEREGAVERQGMPDVVPPSFEPPAMPPPAVLPPFFEPPAMPPPAVLPPFFEPPAMPPPVGQPFESQGPPTMFEPFPTDFVQTEHSSAGLGVQQPQMQTAVLQMGMSKAASSAMRPPPLQAHSMPPSSFQMSDFEGLPSMSKPLSLEWEESMIDQPSASGDSKAVHGAPRLPPATPRGRGTPGSRDLSVLLVAEKPAIAQALAVALAPKGHFAKEKEGRGLASFVFSAPWLGLGGAGPSCCTETITCRYRVTSTVGHVYNLDFPQPLRRWGGDPEALFDSMPVNIEASEEARVPQHLADCASYCHIVILCLDCDREGEAICYEVLDSVLPNLARHAGIVVPESAPKHGESLQGHDFGDDERVWRAHFSSLAAPDLQVAMRTLQKPNPKEARSVDARAEIDLKVGISLTRLLTGRLRADVGDLAPQREAESRHGALISYGPCQTPTLGFCVQRWDEHQRFRRAIGYTIDIRVKDLDGEEVALSWEPPHELALTSEEVGDVGTVSGPAACGGFRERGTQRKDVVDDFVTRIEDRPNPRVVCVSCHTSSGLVERPLALNTVEMLKAASRELRMDPQRTMSLAEKLYLAGLITYPRTETTTYPESLDLKEMLREHSGHRQWGLWCNDLLRRRFTPPRPGADVGDHPPITPVRCADEAEVKQATGSSDGARLYELVTKRFLASVSPDVKYSHHELAFELDGYRFLLTGNEVLHWGFMRISRGAAAAAANATALQQRHLLKPARLRLAQKASRGMRFDVASAATRELRSQPPKLLTEAELLEMMELNRIGTDASMPTHVSNVVARGYVEVMGEDRRMRPTILGVALINGIRAADEELTQAAVRARIEQDVADVAKGIRTCEEVVTTTLMIFRDKYHKVREALDAIADQVRVTKSTQAHLWGLAPSPEDAAAEAEAAAADVLTDVPGVTPAVSSRTPAESATLVRSGASRGEAPKAESQMDVGEPSSTFGATGGDAGACPENASPEELRAENESLRRKLRLALLKVETANLRAENAELKLRDLEKKHASLESRVSKFMPQVTAARKSVGGSAEIGSDGKASGRGRGGGGGKDAAAAPPTVSQRWAPPSLEATSRPGLGCGDSSAKAAGPKGTGGVKRPYAEGSTGLGPGSDVCWSFLKGTCRKGVQCRYPHTSAGQG